MEPADGCAIAGDQLRFNPCMTERALIERPKFRRTDDKDRRGETRTAQLMADEDTGQIISQACATSVRVRTAKI